MSFLPTLLPGLREIRAPILAGYLWLVFAWLLAEPRDPSQSGTAPYDRLGGLAESIGPVGVAIGASVAAYLVGSLLTDIVLWAVDQYVEENDSIGPAYYDEDEQRLATLIYSAEGWVPVGLLLAMSAASGSWADASLGDWRQSMSVDQMCNRELAPGRTAIESAVDSVVRTDEDQEPTFQLIRRRHRQAAAVLNVKNEFPMEGVTTREYDIPTFSIFEDLLAQMAILGTRLRELASETGEKIDRIRAEAEIRFAVAVPLACLVLFFAFEETFFWFFGLLLPLALVKAGFVLRREADLELIDALRARSSEELERITPVFANFNGTASKLADALRRADWAEAEPSDISLDQLPAYLLR